VPQLVTTSTHNTSGPDPDDAVDLPVAVSTTPVTDPVIDPGEWMLALFRDGFFRLPGTPAVWHGDPDLPVRDVVSDLL
jgi:hypothetical protein